MTSITAGPRRVIVYEPTGRWAALLRRASTRDTLQETRTWPDLLAALAQAPNSFVVLELTAANAIQLPARLRQLTVDFPVARFAVVADRALAEYEPLAIEAGAVFFTTSPREADTIAQLADRHAAAGPAPRGPLAEQLWAALPWAALPRK